MMGFHLRDCGPGSGAVRDNLFVRVLYLAHGSEQALLVSFDICFIGREDADRLKGGIGRHLDLTPRQIMLAATHTHSGPASGYWTFGDYLPPNRLFLRELETAVAEAATAAKAQARPVEVWAGMGSTTIPMSRRRRMENGATEFRPAPDAIVCNALPVCLMRDEAGEAVACLFSAAAHPSNLIDNSISAEYPGVAIERINAHLGTDCGLFLLGCAGDAKTAAAGRGRDTWQRNDWNVIIETGNQLATEVIQVLEGGLQQVEPALHTALVETQWPLMAPPQRDELEAIAAQLKPGAPPCEQEVRHLWAARQLELLDRGHVLPASASVLIQGIQLGADLRLIAIEGEPVAEHGLNILKFYDQGVTFPLGYANGEALYLPVSRQLPEGGYEVDSFWEYSYPSRLAPGMEQIVERTLVAFRESDIR
jgi:hypothetical protein